MATLKTTWQKYHQAIITAAIVIVALGFGIAIHYATIKPAPSQQLQQVSSAVSKLIILPTGETPTLATVKDVSKLNNQPIFAHAQNGDKVLVYAKAQEIYVYRPTNNKLVAVGPLILDKSGSPYVTSTIAILDGSGKSDSLDQMTSQVTQKFPNSTIVYKGSAPRLFPASIIIDLTRNNQPLDEQLADTLGISTGQLPLGISAPANAQLLIIIGQK